MQHVSPSAAGCFGFVTSLGSCLHPQVIKANDDLTPEHHQFFLYQMLRGLKYIHSGEWYG